MPDDTRPRGTHRIAKLLARAGVASRRDVERMIADGRVALHGAVLDTPATLLASLAGVTVDGQPVNAPAPARLFRFHKPAGYLTAARDPRGRKTIYDRLPADLPRVVPVGRLDMNTEGLLLLTTDGGLKRELELPATGVPRTYRARAYGEVSQAQLEELMLGVEVDGVRYGQIDANLERRTGRNVWIEMTLTEGKNREVRRVLEYLGLQVGRLIRTGYGPFPLADLPPGAVEEVRQHDLVAFRQALRRGERTAAPSRPPLARAKRIGGPQAAGKPSAGRSDRSSVAAAARPPRAAGEDRKAGSPAGADRAAAPARSGAPSAQRPLPTGFGSDGRQPRDGKRETSSTLRQQAAGPGRTRSSPGRSRDGAAPRDRPERSPPRDGQPRGRPPRRGGPR